MFIKGSTGGGLWGGYGVIPSPGIVRAWRAHGSRAVGTPSGRFLPVSLRLAGDEGRWHVVSVYAPTMQRPDAEKDTFQADLHTAWSTLPAREPAWI